MVISASSEELLSFPFVFMTAYSAVPEGVDCVAPLLEKPFTRAQLLSALDKILQAPPGA